MINLEDTVFPSPRSLFRWQDSLTHLVDRSRCVSLPTCLGFTDLYVLTRPSLAASSTRTHLFLLPRSWAISLCFGAFLPKVRTNEKLPGNQGWVKESHQISNSSDNGWQTQWLLLVGGGGGTVGVRVGGGACPGQFRAAVWQWQTGVA